MKKIFTAKKRFTEGQFMQSLAARNSQHLNLNALLKAHFEKHSSRESRQANSDDKKVEPG